MAQREPTDLDREVHMARYWIEKKGLERALEAQLPLLSQDPAIAAALIQLQNAERAIMARIAELVDQLPEDMEGA